MSDYIIVINKLLLASGWTHQAYYHSHKFSQLIYLSQGSLSIPGICMMVICQVPNSLNVWGNVQIVFYLISHLRFLACSMAFSFNPNEPVTQYFCVLSSSVSSVNLTLIQLTDCLAPYNAWKAAYITVI